MIRDDLRVEKYLQNGERPGGRKMDEFREVKVEKDVLDNAEGSCRVKIGKTEVLCGVKLGTGEPYPDTPDEGALIVNVEFSPIASPEFERGYPREDAVEAARVLDRAVRESKAVDFSDLCLEEGEKVWMLFIDVSVINDDGNLTDACSLAVLGALSVTKVPTYVKKDDSVDREKTKPLKLKEKPLEVSVCKANNHLLMDPSRQEEKAVTAKLTVGSTESKLCAMQKSKSGFFKKEELFEAVDMALKKIEELRKLV